MYLLTKNGKIESGAYATRDATGDIVVQFFELKEDAESYNVQLDALDQALVVTECPSEHIDKLCDIMGYAHTVIEAGQVVVPRLETLEADLEL